MLEAYHSLNGLFMVEEIIMQPKSSKSFNHSLLNVQSALKEHLMKDFSASLALRIIEHNIRKHRVETKNRQDYAKLINAIVSDYQAIQPLGHINVADLKKELQTAVRKIKADLHTASPGRGIHKKDLF
jgi:translation initiation factor 2B subunit (eIF-2B alpha/beta/delta family)